MLKTEVASSWIQSNRDVCAGDACVRNTRHTVAGLVAWKRLGLSDERILEHHPDLTLADLEAAWDYFDGHTAEIEQAVRADEEA